MGLDALNGVTLDVIISVALNFTVGAKLHSWGDVALLVGVRSVG